MAQDPYAHPPLEAVTLPEVLHALSDPLRLSIVSKLRNGADGRADGGAADGRTADGEAAGGERGWSEFECSVSPSTLSHHMKVLRMAGLIRNRREGTRCQVSLRTEIEQRFPGLLATVTGLAPDGRR